MNTPPSPGHPREGGVFAAEKPVRRHLDPCGQWHYSPAEKLTPPYQPLKQVVGIQPDGDGAVVGERHLHIGGEDAGLNRHIL